MISDLMKYETYGGDGVVYNIVQISLLVSSVMVEYQLDESCIILLLMYYLFAFLYEYVLVPLLALTQCTDADWHTDMTRDDR